MLLSVSIGDPRERLVECGLFAVIGFLGWQTVL